MLTQKTQMPTAETALPGRADPLPTDELHFVSGNPLKGPYPDGFEVAVFGMGCFWGAERMFWKTPGVWTTAVGYGAGFTPNPTYQEVCTGQTGHNEILLTVYDTAKASFEDMLKVFWENHDPTQGMGQGNDRGTQYRSGIYVNSPEQRRAAEASLKAYQKKLTDAGYSKITTEIKDAGPFYYAEEVHQQYLAKNPRGYCGLGGTGVACPIGLNA